MMSDNPLERMPQEDVLGLIAAVDGLAGALAAGMFPRTALAVMLTATDRRRLAKVGLAALGHLDARVALDLLRDERRRLGFVRKGKRTRAAGA